MLGPLRLQSRLKTISSNWILSNSDSRLMRDGINREQKLQKDDEDDEASDERRLRPRVALRCAADALVLDGFVHADHVSRLWPP